MKKFKKKRKKNPNFTDLSFGRGSYIKTYLFLGLLFLLYYIAIIGGALNYFTDLIMITLAALFYLTLILALYFIPDEREVELWTNVNENDVSQNINAQKTRNMNNRRFLALFIVFFVIIVIITFLGRLFNLSPLIFQKPLERVFTPMFFLGCLFLVFGFLFLTIINGKMKSGRITFTLEWKKYSLTRYQTLKDISKGAIIFLNCMFLWNYYAFLSKLPMFGPHTLYYIFTFFSVILFFAGTYLIIKILKIEFIEPLLSELSSLYGIKRRYTTILLNLMTFISGCLIYFFISYFVFEPLLNFALFGDYTWILTGVFLGWYLITFILEITKASRGIFGVGLFVSLIGLNFLLLYFQI